MPVYYFPINGEKGNKIVSLMANLSENFEVFVDDALRVETKVGFLTPMLEKLQLEAEVPEQVEPKPEPENRCLVCNKPIEGRAKCCSKTCYGRYYRQQNPGYKSKTAARTAKPGIPPLPNQKKVNENLAEEQARIEAVVARAKDIAPSANFEHHLDGPIMGRKL